jgi:hypothetical protein
VGTVSLWGKAAPSLPAGIKTFVEGWGRNDNVTSASGNFKGDLREAYVDTSLGSFDFRAGRQILAWGRADSLNPTDNLSVRHYTLMVPEDGDQRSGVGSLKVAYNFGDFRLTGLWLPEYRHNTLPIPPRAGVTLSEEDPQDAWNEWAVKLERSGSGVEGSLSYFDGYDRNPDLALRGIGPNGIAIGLAHHRLRVVGADAATNVGKFGLRAEASYTVTENSGATDFQTKRPFFYGVAGADRTFLENLNVNVQYVYRYVSNFRDPALLPDPNARALAIYQAQVNNQLDQSQHGLTARVAKGWLNETLQTEVSGLVWLVRGDFVVRPKVTYAWSDHWKTTVGADWYHGPATSFLGQLQDLTAGYGEIRWDF